MSGDFDFGMRFATAIERLADEEQERRELAARELRFNVQFLDDAMGGILPNDLIVLGASTGSGKTALATLIAQENAKQGKRVHYFALEAEPKEIERRIKYRLLVDILFEQHPHGIGVPLNYRDWYRGKLDAHLAPFRQEAERRIRAQYGTLITYYRGNSFTSSELERLLRAIQDETDLVIVDHLHYVDADDSLNENAAYKQIVKRVRDASLTTGKPVILIAHLRKRDRNSKALVPDIGDFHGSSDITKIATKCILLATAPRRDGQAHNLWGTLMHVPKDRMDGSLRHYVGATLFDTQTGGYQDKYSLFRLGPGAEKLEEIQKHEYPHWARRAQ